MPLSPPQGYRKTVYTHRRGTRANQPAATDVLPGNLYFIEDEWVLERSDGTVWTPYGPIYEFTPPVNGDYTWTNQGTSSVTATNGGIYLLGQTSAVVNVRIRKKTAPATPYTITAGFLCTGVTASVAQGAGIGFRESGSGKLATLDIAVGSGYPALLVTKWTSPTAVSGFYLTPAEYLGSFFNWFRIADNGVNRICSISADGHNFIQVHSVVRTDFLTADEVFFHVRDATGVYTPSMTLLSWKEA
jgi:hypothetical protein